MTLLEIITDVIHRNEAAANYPTHALVRGDLLKEMPGERKQIEKELKELEAAGVIRIGQTINDRYIEVILNQTRAYDEIQEA